MTFPQTITAAEANKETPIGEMFTDLKWAGLLSHNPDTTSGLTFGVNGGPMMVDGVLTVIADQTTLLAASSTNYVEATRAGTISDNATGFTAGSVPLYVVTTSASGVSSFVDWRVWQDLPGIAGRDSVAVTTADVTLSAAQARCDIINVTGALTGNRNLIVPNGPQRWTVTNNTSAAFTLTVKTSAGTGIAITQGKALTVLADGTNVIAASNDATGAGIGDVVGPASATDNDLVRFDGTTGKLVKAGFSYDTDATLAANSDTRVATQAAVKSYITATINARKFKGEPVRAKTTAALAANTYANGTSGVGATLTANANGALAAQDGVTLAASDSLLVANEVAGVNNGIYTVTQVGDAGTPYILTRRTDADVAAELVNATVYVSEGTAAADQQWTCTTNAPITVGTTALVFAQTGSGTTVATDVIWDAAGDLVQGTGANTAARLAIGTAGQVLTVNAGATAAAWAAPGRVGMSFEKELALSDLTTAITTGTTKGYFRPAFAATDVSYRASLRVASSSGIPTIDMNKNGVSMATTTKLTIDATELTSQTAAAAVAMTTTTWAIDDLIELDIDVAGTGAMGLITTVTGKYA